MFLVKDNVIKEFQKYLKIMEHGIIILLFSIMTLDYSYCQPFPPVIVDDTDEAIILSEATPIGTVIRVISAHDGDGNNVVVKFPEYDTDSKTLVDINQTMFGPDKVFAELILKQELDRDYNPGRRSLHFLLEDDSVNNFQTTVVIELIITDVNDEVPVFQNVPYRLELREDHISNAIVYTAITANDPDNGVGGLVSYSMQPITQSTQDAVTFMATFGIDVLSGDITLKTALDYEDIQFFQFTVFAVDGNELQSSIVLTIRVLDIQDTAPQFQGTPYVVTVTENTAIYSHFFTVRAMDGDRGLPNDVLFQFSSGQCLSIFAIHNTTGEVTVAGTIDRDAGEIMDNGGVCELNILVSEINQSPQLGESTAVTTISVFITDENDNAPMFNMDTYSAYIEDTAQLNYPLQFENKTNILIEDLDQASSGILEIILRGKDGDITYDFEPIPSIIASRGKPLITLKSPGLLAARENIVLYIYATERDTPDKHSAVATINIRVLHMDTTTVTTTTVEVTTSKYDDPFIPSILGVVLGFLLLAWAAAATCYYCFKLKGTNNNKVGIQDLQNGEHHYQNGNGHAVTSPLKPVLPPINATTRSSMA